MIDPELRQYLEEQFDLVVRTTKDGFDGVDEQLHVFKRSVDERFNAVDERFDAVDARFKTLEEDIAFLKKRVAAISDELQVLSANMVTKRYLDAKIEALEHRITKSATTDEALKRIVLMLMLVLERHNLLQSEERAKYEMLLT